MPSILYFFKNVFQRITTCIKPIAKIFISIPEKEKKNLALLWTNLSLNSLDHKYLYTDLKSKNSQVAENTPSLTENLEEYLNGIKSQNISFFFFF